MKHALRILLVSALLLAAMELVARLLLVKFHDRRFPAELVQVGRYGTTDGLRPNASGMVWGEPFAVDAFGGRSTGVLVDTSAHYWLFLGDSVGEGVGVDDSSCAASGVARVTKGLRVVNLSHIGYSICHSLDVLRSWTDTCRKVQRTTVLYTLNDVYARSGTDKLPSLRREGATALARAWAQDHVAIYRLLKLLILQGSDHYYRYDRAFYDPENPHWQGMLACLDELHTVCDERGIALEIVVLPYRSQVEGSSDRLPQDMVMQACRDRGIDCWDALEEMRSSGNASDLYLFADEIHPNRKGHDRISRSLILR